MKVKVYLDRKARKKFNLVFLPCDQQLFRSKKPLRIWTYEDSDESFIF
jgi:hypothetical protein